MRKQQMLDPTEVTGDDLDMGWLIMMLSIAAVVYLGVLLFNEPRILPLAGIGVVFYLYFLALREGHG